MKNKNWGWVICKKISKLLKQYDKGQIYGIPNFLELIIEELSEFAEEIKLKKQDYEDWFGDQVGWNNAVKAQELKIKEAFKRRV